LSVLYFITTNTQLEFICYLLFISKYTITCFIKIQT